MKKLSSIRLIVLSSIFLMLFGNVAFFTNVAQAYPPTLLNVLFMISLALVFGCGIVLLFSVLCFGVTTKPVLILILIASAFASYFMDSYNVIIDGGMIRNMLETNTAEAHDLMSGKLLLYVVLLGLLPAIFVYRAHIITRGFKVELLSRIKLVAAALLVSLVCILTLGNFYASFVREHKSLRFYANPTYYVYSAVKFAGSFLQHTNLPLQPIGMDAQVPQADSHRELVIMVVGETGRADRFSLNGYARETNPLLKKKNVLSFNNVWSCGTATAVSVPCMFSIYGRADFDQGKADTTENLLDVLHHAGVNVVWLDNNSDSKGVALRIPYEDYKTPATNPVCDVECRDEGMLTRLQTYIDQHPQGDIFIVLHQMGNHGPAYYKRYPAAFEKFTPACHSNQLESCSAEEIGNAYDNAILYTDYFLSKVIGLLEHNDDDFESALLYVSDHGESLGENGLYLHGLPYLIAPDAQKHVPLITWFSNSMATDDIDVDRTRRKTGNPYSHDNVFHVVLGLLEVNTKIYNPKLDFIAHRE